MALSGIFYGTTSNPRIKPQISWEAVQSVAGNYSDITAKLQYTRSNSGYTTGGTWSGSLTIDGDTLSKRLYMEITYGNTTTVITHTVRVYHDAEGKKSVTISGTGGIVSPAEASLKTTEISKTVSLDTIPRVSDISATDCNIGANSTVVVSKKNADFTHSIGYAFGTLTGFVSAGGQPVETAERFSQTVVNFRVPESFYAQIPDSPTGVCRLTCRTYQGQTELGSSSTEFVVTAAENLCAPEVSFSVEDANLLTNDLTGDPVVFVLNASQAKCRLTAQAKHSASIVKKTLLGADIDETALLDPLTTEKITYSVTDSRGYRTEQTYTANVVAYMRPTVNVSVRRDSPTADTATVTVTGQCFAGSFGAKDNTLHLEVYVDGQLEDRFLVTVEADNSYAVTKPLSYVPYQQSAQVRVVGTDKLFAAEKTVVLPAGVPVFDWGAEDFCFRVPVYVPKLYVGEIVNGELKIEN